MRQRFEREAKTISQLSHPHICALYDVGREGETDYLVMEYLEGETLADRLGKGAAADRAGPALRDRDRRRARQGAPAGDRAPGPEARQRHAHEVGREAARLRPGEAARGRGRAAGLGRVGPGDRGAGEPAADRARHDPRHVPVHGARAARGQGGGRAHATSSPSARVLYEMATGRKAFTGKSQASLIGVDPARRSAAISEIAPMIAAGAEPRRQDVPRQGPEDRFQTAHDVKLQLQWIAEGGSQAGLPAPVVARRKNREKLAWAVAAVAVARRRRRSASDSATRAPKPPRVVRFEIADAAGRRRRSTRRAISPDGRSSRSTRPTRRGKTQIWLRPLERARGAAARRDGGDAARPFWSPDSRFLGFFADGKLKKIDVAGGPPQKICDAPTGVRRHLEPRGRDPLRRHAARIRSTASPPRAERPSSRSRPTPRARRSQVGWPEFLPDGRHFLYMAIGQKVDDSAYRIGSLDSKETKPFAPGAVACSPTRRRATCSSCATGRSSRSPSTRRR